MSWVPAAIQGASALAAGGLNFLGGTATNKANREISSDQMRFQREQNQTQMDFQERMSNTQYQRAMADMSAAGLNPILAYSQGGAGTPSGSTSSGASIPSQNPVANAVSSALDARRMFAEVKNMEVQNENLKKLTDEIKSRTKLNTVTTQLKETELPGAKLEQDLDTAGNGWLSLMARWIDRLNPLKGVLKGN